MGKFWLIVFGGWVGSALILILFFALAVSVDTGMGSYSLLAERVIEAWARVSAVIALLWLIGLIAGWAGERS